MKKLVSILFSLIVPLIFVSCSFGLPKKVSVVSEAEYNFSLGNIDKSFDDNFNMSSLFESSSLGNIRVYDYFPEKRDARLQEFLLDIPFQEIPVNIGAYFNNSAMSTDINGLSFNKSVEIPSMDISFEKVIDKDTLNTSIGALLTIAGAVNTGNGKIMFSSSAAGENQDFNSIVYTSGNFVLTGSDIPDGTTVTLQSNGISRTAVFNGGEASININNFTFTKDGTYLSFSGGYGSAYLGRITTNSVVKEALGVTANTTPTALTITMPITDATNTLQSCTIKDGNLKTNVIFPNTWSNYNIYYSLSSTGAISFNSPELSTGIKTIDLHNKTITPGNATISLSVQFSFNNSHIDLSNDIKIKIETAIQTFDSITVTAEGLNNSISQTDDLPVGIIKKINLKQSGLKGTYTNGLPEGNDIVIKANSTIFNINNKQAVLESQKTNTNFNLMSDSSATKLIKVVETPSESDEFNQWDFSVAIQLPGYDAANPNRVTLRNVSPGRTYNLAVTLNVNIDWEYAVIDVGDTTNTQTIPLGLRTATLFSSMADVVGEGVADKIFISSLPFYLMAEKPSVQGSSGTNIFDQARFTGRIELFCGRENADHTITKLTDSSGNYYQTTIFDSSTSSNPLGFVYAPTITKEGNTVITDIKDIDKSIETDLAGIINTTKSLTEGELYLDYSLTFSNGENDGEITITKDMLNLEDNNVSVKIYGYLILPVKFRVSSTEDLDINILTMLGSDSTSDILSRDGPTDLSAFEEVFPAIKKCSLVYNTTKIPFYSNPPMKLKMDFFNDGNVNYYTVDSSVVALTSEQIQDMFRTYPFRPQASIFMERGSVFSIPRELSIDMNLAIKLETDGEIRILGGSN